MGAMQEDHEAFREACRDLGFLLFKPVIALVELIPGLRVKPWVRERQIRERWHS